ncbi:MAG TPA: hypothetical protein VJ753_06985 [Rhizomicrobium sp.]|nr:hypothetical protein [Rhizomicrobium sp.]
MIRIALTLSTAILLAGCVNSSSETVRSMPADLMKNGKVAAITVKEVPSNTSPEFRGKMESQLRQAMDHCATGTEPLDLEVSVTDFKGNNAAKAILIGDSNNIKGQARLRRANGGDVVGDFDIARSVGAGGIAGALVMSYAEDKTAFGFAAEICKRAFGKAPYTQPRRNIPPDTIGRDSKRRKAAQD